MKSFKSKLCVNQVLTITLVSFLYMVLSAGLHAQNVAITDDDGYTVNSSAMLDVKSINKGLLIPRVALVSTTDPVSGTKPEGLLVWSTSTSGSYPDPGFYYWSGANWVKVGSSALDFQNGLTQSGNSVKLGGALTESSTITQGDYSLNFNLSGTGDFNIQDAGTSAFFVKEDGNVGIGTTSPEHKLELNGNLKLGDNIMLEGSANYRVYRNLVSYSASPTTGAFVINTNQPINSSCMFKVKIEGYMYKSSGPLEIIIGAYVYNDFRNQGHLNIGSEKLEVRLARNISTNNMAIILGDVGTSYPYPKLTVTEFYQGHSGKTESYADGWTITRITDLLGYDYIEDVPDVTNMDNRYYTETEVDNLLSGENLWDKSNGNLYPHTITDNVGIGTTTPGSRLEVYGNESGSDNDPLFDVKNNEGQTIFAVYPEGVRIYVDEDVTKGLKGGFAVGGFSSSKGITNEYLRVTPDTFRIYVDDTGVKGLKGGFAVGGYGASKGLTNEYLRITPDSVRIYVDNEPGSKGLKGGFAVGGFSSSKGYEDAINFMDITPENYFIGHESGQQITNGKYNTFFGFESGYSTEGGIEVGPGQWEGCNNIFIGYQSGYENITGYKNVFIGYKSGANNTSGEKNIFIGNESGMVNTTGGYNSFIGYNAGILNSSGIGNTFLGSNCGFYNSTGGFNTCLGSHTGEYLDACSANTFIGTYSGHGGGLPGGYPSVRITGNSNTFLGYRSGYENLSGSNNTYLGYQSGHDNVNGSGNVFIGSEAGYNEAGSNRLYIDNTDTSTPLIYGDFSSNKLRFNAHVGIGILPSSYKLHIVDDYLSVYARSTSSTTGSAYGVYGYADGANGVRYGVYGRAISGTTNYAVYGRTASSTSNYAGYFYGNVNITGNVSKGSGSFKIDHPLDPKNKYLYHSFVESPDMMNIYNGNVILDETGEAYVTMPDWFEALNMEFRYQLTAIGAPGPNLYIAEEVSGNSFKIAGGSSGIKVSWQVTGIRHDKFAEKNRIKVEVDKNSEEKGLYLHPEAFSQPEEKGIDYKISNEMKESNSNNIRKL